MDAPKNVLNAAKCDGLWNALNAVEAFEIPYALAATLRAHQQAAMHFDAFPRAAKCGILEWIANAKQSQMGANRIDEAATPAAKIERVKQWRDKARLAVSRGFQPCSQRGACHARVRTNDGVPTQFRASRPISRVFAPA
jgi:hypothetical protein